MAEATEASELAVELLSKARSVASGSRRIDQHDLSGAAQLIDALRRQDAAAAANADLTRPGGGVGFQQIKPVYR